MLVIVKLLLFSVFYFIGSLIAYVIARMDKNNDDYECKNIAAFSWLSIILFIIFLIPKKLVYITIELGDWIVSRIEKKKKQNN